MTVLSDFNCSFNCIYYETQGERVEDFSSEDADNYIELNGMKSELFITREEA